MIYIHLLAAKNGNIFCCYTCKSYWTPKIDDINNNAYGYIKLHSELNWWRDISESFNTLPHIVSFACCACGCFHTTALT